MTRSDSPNPLTTGIQFDRYLYMKTTFYQRLVNRQAGVTRSVSIHHIGRLAGTLFLLAFFLAVPLSCETEENEIFPDAEFVYEIHFIDVGQGDAILFISPDVTMLVDGGTRWGGVTGYLDQQGIEEIDIVIGTHPHADHIGGLIAVFENYTVGEVYDPGVIHTTLTFEDYLRAIDEYEIPFTVARRGMERTLGDDVRMTILHPPDNPEGSLNNSSVVTRITFGELSLLLTGDLEMEGELELISTFDNLQSTILKAGHHGSYTSSTTRFLNEVKPEVSVIMCGRDNQYGHPHGAALARLESASNEVYRTDLHGHILIESNGYEYTVTTSMNESE